MEKDPLPSRTVWPAAVIVVGIVVAAVVASALSETRGPQAPGRDAGEGTAAAQQQAKPWKTYRNAEYGFEVGIPPKTEATTTMATYYHLSDAWSVSARPGSAGKAVVSVPVFRVANDASYPRYFDAELRIGASKAAADVESCLKPALNETASGPAVINGTEFASFEAQSAGMMQYMRAMSFRAVRNGTCYAVEQILAGSSYRDEPTPNDIPDDELAKKFESVYDVVKTFKFTR